MTRILPRLALLFAVLGGASTLQAAPYVCLEMNVGTVCLEMLPQAAPNTVANFLRYVDDLDYHNSVVHRSEPNFVIQGGGFVLQGNNLALMSLNAPIANELGLSNLRGTVAMARNGTNTNSATSQWFINLKDNTALDTASGGYTVFARVVTGMNVVDDIAALPRVNLAYILGTADFLNVPTLGPQDTVPTAAQLVRVIRAYRNDTVPYQCSVTSPSDTLTEFCGSTVTFPVLVNGKLYEGTLDFIPGRADLAFSVDMSKLKALSDTGQQRATFAAGVLTIPSVRYGAKAYDNVTLQLTNPSLLEFTLTGATPR